MPLFVRQEQECRYAYLSPAEFDQRLADKAILFLALGSLEWHNEHLPLGTDTMIAFQFAMRLCHRIGGVVLPAFWWNTGRCHDSRWTYHMPEDVYRATLKNVCLGLASLPAKLLVLINGHGGDFQASSPGIVAGALNSGGFPIRVITSYPYDPGPTRLAPIDHANTGETSVAMELIPKLVRMERELVPDIFSGEQPFVRRGTPTAERGHRLWEAYWEEAQAMIESEYARLSE
jgi:creatinine amidohydrolase